MKKKINFTVDEEVLEIFNFACSINSTNKSALIQKFMIKWVDENLTQKQILDQRYGKEVRK